MTSCPSSQLLSQALPVLLLSYVMGLATAYILLYGGASGPEVFE